MATIKQYYDYYLKCLSREGNVYIFLEPGTREIIDLYHSNESVKEVQKFHPTTIVKKATKQDLKRFLIQEKLKQL